MIKSHQCPKCESHDVIFVKGGMGQTEKISLNKWSLRWGKLNRYICAICGYTEEYVQLTDGFKNWAAKALIEQKKKGGISGDFV